jgi:hypothetical protein
MDAIDLLFLHRPGIQSYDIQKRKVRKEEKEKV